MTIGSASSAEEHLEILTGLMGERGRDGVLLMAGEGGFSWVSLSDPNPLLELSALLWEGYEVQGYLVIGNDNFVIHPIPELRGDEEWARETMTAVIRALPELSGQRGEVLTGSQRK